jgi:hypothetical protein
LKNFKSNTQEDLKVKQRRFLVSIGLSAFLAAAVFIAPAHADTYIKLATYVDGYEIMGQKVPAEADTNITWFAPGKIRMDHGDTSSVIVLMDKNAIYSLNHKTKSYREIPFDAIGDVNRLIEREAGSKEGADSMKQMIEGMMSMMKVSAEVTPTEETKEILGYKCKKYLVKMNMGTVAVNSELWATEDIKVDYDMYNKASYSFMLQFPGIDKAIEEMKKVKGFTVSGSSSMTMMGANVNTSTKLLVAEEKPSPAGTFEIPKDYIEVGGGGTESEDD